MLGRGRGPQGNTNTNPQGQPEGSESGSQTALDKMIDSGMKRVGSSYGLGQHHYAPIGQPVSCSGLIYSMRQDAGLPNPYWGTYGYYNNYCKGRMGMRIKYVGGQSYSAGTLFVAIQGAGGSDGTHVAMSIGGGKVIESIGGAGVKTSPQPGTFADKTQIVTGLMPDVGTKVTDVVTDPIGEGSEAVGEAVGNMAGDIAEGIAQGLLRVVKYIYGKVILQPLDFVSGFWWEFLKHFWGQFGGSTGSTSTEESSPETEGEESMTDEHGDREFIVRPGEFGGGSF